MPDPFIAGVLGFAGICLILVLFYLIVERDLDGEKPRDDFPPRDDTH